MLEENLNIWVFVEKEEVVEEVVIRGERSSGDTGGGYESSPNDFSEKFNRFLKKERIPLDAQALKAQLNGLLQVMDGLFSQAENNSEMRLDEVTLSVEINAEGQIGIVGNGGKFGNTGGITMKFVRSIK